MGTLIGKTLSAAICIAGAGFSAAADAGRVRFDFENGSLQGWEVVEGAFEKVVTDRATEYNTRRPQAKSGTWFLSTLESFSGKPEAGPTGVVESPTVRIDGREVSFWIGGGKRGVHFALIDRETGREIVRATGRNAEPLRRETWRLPESAVGRTAFFRVTDAATGSWGYIAVDGIEFDGAVVANDFDARGFLPPGAVQNAEKAIRELGERNAQYPAEKFLAALRVVEGWKGRGKAKMFDELLLRALVRENPLLSCEIIYTTHAMWRPDHHNTETLFQCGEINEAKYVTHGAMRALDPRTGERRDIVSDAPGRTVRDPEVDWDGRRIVFSMRNGRKDDYHIYTVNPDGTGLAQLTRAAGVSDIDPAWLPDGDIVFASTREPKYCMCNRNIMCNLFKMKPDGANIHQIGKSTLFEGHPAILPDGRILYDRWEYVDRNYGDAQGLWTCNPDGTRHAVYWGNNTVSPGGVLSARALSSPSRAIAVLCACHDRHWGALGLIDRSLGVDGRDSVLRTWPASFREEIRTEADVPGSYPVSGGHFVFDTPRTIPVKYADPFPIDDAHFLCVRQTGHGEETAIYYLDLHGNEVLVAKDAPGCHSPVLLRPSKKPAVQAEQRTYDAPDAPGRFYVQNVYVGTHMKGVAKGSIKALRVVESPEKRIYLPQRSWFSDVAPAMNWHSFENKRILGTVPVEEDGSAYFEVPGNTYVYFQALDADGRMVQSMRSGAYLQPGERYGCVGCHESRTGDVPKAEKKPLALSRAPSKLDGAYNLKGLEKGTPPHLYSYQREVQPIFDRRCVSCHDYGKKAGEKLNLSGDRGAYFCTSYVDLWALGHVKCIGAGPSATQPAYSWGSCVSPLVKKLYGHGKSGITEEERDRVITWLDINAPYWPCYEFAFPDSYGGRMPITRAEHDKLQKITGVRIPRSFSPPCREQLNFDRPELSRILDAVKGKPAYDTALAIIRKGLERLKATPRADMDGFVPCAENQAFETRYRKRQECERRSYDAIRTGRTIYDHVVTPMQFLTE